MIRRCVMPPIGKVWRGLMQGVVDVLGSDHAPHTREEKNKAYPASPSGMTGVQTLVPIMLDALMPVGFRSSVLLISPAPGRRVSSASHPRGASPRGMTLT